MTLKSFEKYLEKKVRIKLWSNTFHRMIDVEGVLKKEISTYHIYNRLTHRINEIKDERYVLDVGMGVITIKKSEIKDFRKRSIEVL